MAVVSPVKKVQAQVAEQDSLALLAIYNALDGENWTFWRAWRGNFSVASWSGVTVEEIPGEGMRVTRLNLWRNGMTGELPDEMGDLTYLKEINFNENNITGNIPESFKNLKHLREFLIDNNQLTGFPDISENSFQSRPEFACNRIISILMHWKLS